MDIGTKGEAILVEPATDPFAARRTSEPAPTPVVATEPQAPAVPATT